VLTYRVSPVYPPAARLQRLSGDVRVSATIGKDGVPRDLRPVSGDPRLVDAAMAAIQQWRYAPARLDGDARDSQITITVSFQLNKQ
jgi:periplasmic protein TonB